eukprot:CAMPEP_0119285450 /NCGR_PEP_ID=MMETSP1329-20130426/32203_1 /TAXON_ID=114041 /ORGANISM="Genus nov. species nov., Strain RCC1024" /LENGTH=167 /DNA_ID=CAMNT_0007286161 /DNA_START=158 /DNA_END=657 /DNA_ORIENTATION=-
MAHIPELMRRFLEQTPVKPLGAPFGLERQFALAEDETRLLRRPVVWEVCNEDGRGASAQGAGHALLSDQRVLLIRDEGPGAQLPLRAMVGEPAYEQPIFGCNYLEGKASLRGETVAFVLRFTAGSSMSFITVFYRALGSARVGYAQEGFLEALAVAQVDEPDDDPTA